MIASEHVARELAMALTEVIVKGRFAHSVLQKKLAENRTWDDEQRSGFAGTTYFAIRNWRRLWYAIDETQSDLMPPLLRLSAAALLLHGESLSSSLRSSSRIDVRSVHERWKEAEGRRVLRY